jgi:hypothetical protein
VNIIRDIGQKWRGRDRTKVSFRHRERDRLEMNISTVEVAEKGETEKGEECGGGGRGKRRWSRRMRKCNRRRKK